MRNQDAAIAIYNATHKNRSYTKVYWDIANVIGIAEAALIEIIENWCQLNEIRQNSRYFKEGQWWTSATYDEWASRFSGIGSARTIQRLFLKLEKSGYILSGQFNKKGDRTKFYRVNAVAIGQLLLNGEATPGKTEKQCDSIESTGIVPNLVLCQSESTGIVPNLVLCHPGIVPKMDVDGAKSARSLLIDHLLDPKKELDQREEADSLSGNFFNEEEEDALSEASASESRQEESQGEEVDNISSLVKEQLNCNKYRESDLEDKYSAPALQQVQKDVNDNKLPEWAMGQNDDGTFQASRDFVAWLANDYWVAKGDKYARNKSYARAYLEKAGKIFRANELWEEYQSRIGEIEFVAQLREQMKPADSSKCDRITDEERIAKFSAIQEQILALKNKADS